MKMSIEDLDRILCLKGLKFKDELTRMGSNTSLLCYNGYITYDGEEFNQLMIWYDKEIISVKGIYESAFSSRSLLFELNKFKQLFEKELRIVKLEKITQQ